jgi:hypothetical protein
MNAVENLIERKTLKEVIPHKSIKAVLYGILLL